MPGCPGIRLLAPLFFLIQLTPACVELELLTEGSGGGPGPPYSGSLSVIFIDVGHGDGVLVQAGGESYLMEAGRPEGGPNVVDFLVAGTSTRLMASWAPIPEVDRTTGIGFRALLTEDGIERLELAKASSASGARLQNSTDSLTSVHNPWPGSGVRIESV